MKNDRNERLSEHLLNIDQDILAHAYEIDDAEKLKQYVQTKNAKTKRPFYMTPVFRRAAVIAGCFVLIVGVMLSVPALFRPTNLADNPANNKETDRGNDDRDECVLPWSPKEEEEYLTINSIDMLNYYAAMRALVDPTETANASSYKTGASATLLSASVNTNAKSYGFTFLSDTNAGVGYDMPPEGYNPDSQDRNEEKVYYYELDPNEIFSVYKVVFFQIDIKNADGFLASKVGTGIVDVVITENSLEPMITFKNGDRYYSCCENTLLDNGKLYSTHKYIEDFFIVKNLEQENYSFSVEYSNFNLDYRDVTAKSVTCGPYKNGGSIPDGEMSVIGETYISDHSVEMTVADLEEYFNASKVSNENDSEEPSVSATKDGSNTNKAEITKLVELDRYSAMTRDGTASIEVDYTYVDETETVYAFVIEDATIIDSLMSAIFNMELEDFPDDRDFSVYYRVITVNQNEQAYTIDLFAASNDRKAYLCRSQEVRNIIERYIEDNLIK